MFHRAEKYSRITDSGPHCYLCGAKTKSRKVRRCRKCHAVYMREWRNKKRLQLLDDLSKATLNYIRNHKELIHGIVFG